MAESGRQTPEPVMRIMLVDDDPFVREVAATALAAVRGVTVATCGSGAEALAAYPAFKPDLLLLDLMMPVMDGRMLWKAVAALSGPKPRLIFLTGRDDDATRAEVLELGAQAVIAKPFDPSVFAETVLGLANEAAARSQKLERLAREFVADLPVALAEMAGAWRDMSAQWDGATAERLLARAHRIAGVAPMFGFGEVGQAADRLEEIMRAVVGNGGWAETAEQERAEAALAQLADAINGL